MNRLQTIIDWTCAARKISLQLDNEADGLLTRLQMLQAQETALNETRSTAGTVALYGHSQAAKAHLLYTLCGSADGRLLVRTGSKTLDYLSHLNPGHTATQMALRFCHKAEIVDEAFPLRLRLMSEAELVQVFISHALRQEKLCHVKPEVIAARLEGWQTLRQPSPVTGISEKEVAAVVRFWQTQIPASQPPVDDALWQQFIQLIPHLDLSARASAWALLWGEQQPLTQQWILYARELQHCGYARELAAPLSLLIDSFSLPVKGFLTRQSDSEGETIVHPLKGHQRQNAVIVSLRTLALLTTELLLPVENSVLSGIDIVDIPACGDTETGTLQTSKCRWLIEHYRQRFQPDLLLICNAVHNRSEIPGTARQLMAWVNETQPSGDGSLPGLIWTIPPQDNRFVQGINLDDAVQQLIEQPGQRWGTLQALDSSDMQRLIAWLTQATVPALRNARLQLIADRIRQQARQIMAPYSTEQKRDPAQVQQQAEGMVRELQRRAAILGELLADLLPPSQHFASLIQKEAPREEQVSALFNEEVDLFAQADQPPQKQETQHNPGIRAHALWVRYLRQWSNDEASARRFDISPATLQMLADSLIMTSYRLGLPQQLQAVMANEYASISQLQVALSNWLTWLGYTDIPAEQRPASRIVKDSTLFASAAIDPARLMQPGESPQHAATRYVYDWLVALFTRVTEAPDYHHPQSVPPSARKHLSGLL